MLSLEDLFGGKWTLIYDKPKRKIMDILHRFMYHLPPFFFSDKTCQGLMKSCVERKDPEGLLPLTDYILEQGKQELTLHLGRVITCVQVFIEIRRYADERMEREGGNEANFALAPLNSLERILKVSHWGINPLHTRRTHPTTFRAISLASEQAEDNLWEDEDEGI